MNARRAGSRAASLWLVFVLIAWALALMAPPARAADPAQGPGGPILVVTSGPSTHGTYYAEILRTEGFNAFQVASIVDVTAPMLAGYDVVLLAKMPLTAPQVSMLSNWVTGGGNLIAMAPDAQLAGLLGLTVGGTPLAEGYLLVDTTSAPGNGIVGQTMQFHGSANRWTLSGATSIATLYSSASTATGSPAVSLRKNVGSGNAAAFAYDLATSIVYTRHGNPAWATQERDGVAPIRPDDKFYGAKAGDVQNDWVDLNKVSIPQADEQQRLLANLIVAMNDSRKPLPRFWYFPNGKKAVVIMTGDDHGNGGTAGRFEKFKELSPGSCSVANWECVRGTSYVYTSTPLTDAQVAQYTAEGFEVGVHVTTWCADFTASSLQATYDEQVPEWLAKFPSGGPLRTQRHHCIVWSDWSSGAEVQLSKGMRLDTSYYFWPPSWVADVPGMFTGSAMPMRFTKPDGSFVDVYMAATQMTDESGQTYPKTINTLLDRAVGAEGYYGAYTVNAHTDSAQSDVADAVVTSALARGVPIVSAKQMLTWLDGRNASSFGAIAFNGVTLSFTVTKDVSANGLQAMLPLRSGSALLLGLTRQGATVEYSVNTVKGVDYAFFAVESGSYAATYGVDSTAPVVVSQTPGSSGVDVGAAVIASFNEAMDAATIDESTFFLRDAANALVSASVSYDSASRTATLKPTAALAGLTTYTATLRGGTTDPRVKDLAGNAFAGQQPLTWSFTTAAAPSLPSCPCSAWDASTTPTNPQQDLDTQAVELGVKFRVDVDGFVTGIRFYKGAGNTGSHSGSLWSFPGGTRLATADFTGESASGWQQVNFATPVAITAGTVYVASYHAPNGRYAGDNGYFASTGVDKAPVHLLQSGGVNGGNGVYRYGSTSGFPTDTYNATNYWVDVVFSATAPPDTTPPAVSNVSPAAGATGVATTTAVSATFSEAMDAATIVASFELRDAANVLVASSVSYDAPTRKATLTPTAALAAAQTYTATVSTGAKDAAGNALAAPFPWSFTTGGGTGGCSTPPNPIVAENCLAGSPASEWDISGSGDPSIQGFATDISVNRGGTVFFKVKTDASSYRFDIYRMGYYDGLGARKVGEPVNPSAALPQNQPNCINDAATGLIDCGNWSVSGSWAVPASATSGIYIAKLTRTDTGGASHIVFIVRDDASTAPFLFQTSDTTWQAYNNYGGNSLYTGSPAGRAYKVSYNRPFNTREVDGGQDWLFNAEYPMVRWLESNGYDVAYISGVDTDRRDEPPQGQPRLATEIRRHKVFLSVGHDEYWSDGQRSTVTVARDAGVHLAFFSGNEIFWKTRWENSIDGSSTKYRTLVCYKETHANAKIDPTPTWTGTWRDPRFSPPADGGRPENGLTGTIFMVNAGATTSIVVPAADGKMRFWRNTPVASLAPNTSATMPSGTLGYEWDVDADNGFRPPGLIRLSTTTVPGAPVLQDFGSTYSSGTATHSLTLYRHASGALVFGAGTVQWVWGLDATHDRSGTPTNASMQQATVNLFADMDVQPATLRQGLVAASASTDTTRPTSTIASPTAGSTLAVGTPVTISGSASDGGGVVGGVEISVDGGTSWHPAVGRGSWSYVWTPPSSGTFTIWTRAVDDSGNLQVPGAGITVTAGSVPDTTAPTVSAMSPANNATGVARTVSPTVTFSEAIDPSTINSTTFELRNATNALVSAVVSYAAATRRATLNPSGNLAARTRFTATVRGGATGVKDLAGNPLAGPVTWTFTTR